VDKRKLYKNRNTDNRSGIDSVKTRQNYWFVLTGILLVNGDELNLILPKVSRSLYLFIYLFIFLIRPFGTSINK